MEEVKSLADKASANKRVAEEVIILIHRWILKKDYP